MRIEAGPYRHEVLGEVWHLDGIINDRHLLACISCAMRRANLGANEVTACEIVGHEGNPQVRFEWHTRTSNLYGMTVTRHERVVPLL